MTKRTAKYPLDELKQLYQQLIKAQSTIKTLIGGLIGMALAIMAFWAMAKPIGENQYFISLPTLIIVFLPPVMMGFFAKLYGQSYNLKPRLSVGIIALLFHIATIYLMQIHPIWYLLAPVVTILAIYIAKIKLTNKEWIAIDMAELGKFQDPKEH
jgi:hypothetical protein